jgi:hypothetical protein
VTDCLSILVKSYERQGLISSIRMSRCGLGISHLLFVDDSILFFKLDGNQTVHVRDLFALFDNGIGQKLSPSKC